MSSHELVSQLHELARAHGIETAYQDMNSRWQEAGVESLLAVLQALGAHIRTLDDVPAALLDRRRALRRRVLEPVTVVWDGKPEALNLRVPLEEASGLVKCDLELDSGEVTSYTTDITELPAGDVVEIDGRQYGVKHLPLPERLPFGYHRLRVQVRKELAETMLICSPLKAYQAAEKQNRRFWGLFVPAYALRSERSFDGGDFSDLGELIDWVCHLGGSVVATLPLLASFLDEPFDPSPYTPVSRLFWNEFYIDVTKIPELESCPAARDLLESGGFQQEIAQLRSMPEVDYKRLMALKRRVLEELADVFFREPSARRKDFELYKQSTPRLEDYARFRASCENNHHPWWKWPEPMRQGRLSEENYSEKNKRYHEYVQWIAHDQLNELSAIACNGGLGLYLDLPLGVHPEGYDVWRVNGLFVKKVATGAPPDIIFTGGQNWGFPPLHPEEIRRQGYKYVIEYLRHHMGLAGVLRVDHVMGLHRLFWVPEGMSASEGVYVQYSPEELYAIYCLESHRRKCLVVGENLGTVPPYVNETMEAHGLHTMYVTQYELTRDPESALKDAPGNAVASLNTHDMPPFAAYWEGLDIEDRVRLDFLDESKAKSELENRQELKQALVSFLEARGWLSGGNGTNPNDVLRASLAFLAAGRARIVLANLEDLWLETKPQNIPGTTTQNANWRRKARFRLDEFSRMPEIVDFLRRIDGLVRGQDSSSGCCK